MPEIDLPALRAVYSRLGSEARLLALLETFYARMAKDTMIGFFFEGRDVSKIAHRQGEFLLRAMGARPSYPGKAPADAHTHLAPILPGHFDRRLRILEDVLRAAHLPEPDIATWLSFENAFRDAIQT